MGHRLSLLNLVSCCIIGSGNNWRGWRRASSVWRDNSCATTHGHNRNEQLSTTLCIVVCLVSTFREVKAFPKDRKGIVLLLGPNDHANSECCVVLRL